MIKLMIVDDEAMIRQGLRKAVDWEAHGIRIVAEARSGNSAMEKALQHRPDIVISDIRMSEGDGILLAQRLLESLPQTRIIMLSGYSDIEYMMEAIKLGVREYMLKPTGSEQILQSVIKLRDDILQQREEEQQSARMESLINENLDMLRQHFLEELLGGHVAVGQVGEQAGSLMLPLAGPLYQLFVAAPLEGHEWEMLQILTSQLEASSPVLATADGLVAAILNVDTELDWALAVQVAGKVRDITDPMQLPCLGAPCSAGQLPAQYAACRERMARSLWLEGPVLSTADDAAFPPLPDKELLRLERSIIQEVRAGSPGELAREVGALFALFRQYKTPAEQFREATLGIARSIQVFSESVGLYESLEALFQGPYTADSVAQTFLGAISNDFTAYGPQVAGALRFIQEHCASELSLPEVAASLYISPSYLTRLLKNKTSRGFNEWLHTMRIEKAKELLVKTDLRHYEIAERVGYHSYKIFSEYFSKIVGCSARRYREELPRKEPEGAAVG